MTGERERKTRSFSIDSSARSFRIVDAGPGKLVLGGLVVLSVFLAFFALPALFLVPHRPLDAALAEDVNNARQIVQILAVADGTHGDPDGRIDVYSTFFSVADRNEDNARILRHHRGGAGPTIAEIRAGDYRNFVWERARADDVRNAKEKVPVIWDPRPFDGKRVVGFSNGLVRILDEEEFQELRR